MFEGFFFRAEVIPIFGYNGIGNHMDGLLMEDRLVKDMVKQWKHIFKIDPEREIDDTSLELLCMSGTDAIMVGGSTGTTFENVIDLLARIRRYEVACVLEVSHVEAIVPGYDLYFIPLVLNAQDPEWLLKPHREALKQLGGVMNWDEVMIEGYIVLNRDSKVAEITQSETDLTESDVVAYARMVDRMLRFPICYIEYSGSFGNLELVQKTRSVLKEAQLLYGGGIDTREKALKAKEAADTIVVGNVIYNDLEKALETVV
jgi:putative glycerol-1-phosphate prenyltransferase